MVHFKRVIGTVHLLTGAMIGALIPDAATVVALAFFSHYLLDYVPHIDPETFTKSQVPFTWRQLTIVVFDTVSTILFALIFYFYHSHWLLILLGGVTAQLPDLMIPLQKYRWFAPLRIFHDMWHWKKERAQQWSWYIAGLCTQAIVGGLALLVVWQ